VAATTAVVPLAFRGPQEQLRHGADLIGVARWSLQTGKHEQALALLRRAVEMGLPDALLFRTLWDIAAIEKKVGREDAALAVLSDLAATRNPYRARALVEMARFYEHRERNYTMALEMTRGAMEIAADAALRKREARLLKRIAGKRRTRQSEL